MCLISAARHEVGVLGGWLVFGGLVFNSFPLFIFQILIDILITHLSSNYLAPNTC